MCACGRDSLVIDSRSEGPVIRRRRECQCGARWTTWESRHKPTVKDLQLETDVSAEWLAPVRKLAGLTQRDIGARIGRSVSYVSQLERGSFTLTKRVVNVYRSLGVME